MNLYRKTTTMALFAFMMSFSSVSLAQSDVKKLKVVSSFTIIADMVKNVGGDQVIIDTLAGHDVDLHHFEPRPGDLKKLTSDGDAALLFINGLELEPWVESMQVSSGYRGKTVVVSQGVKTIQLDDIHQQHSHDDHHGDVDPHAWQNPLNALIYIDNILQALKAVDPGNASLYEQNATDYQTKLKNLHKKNLDAFARLPEHKRRFGTNHEAFAYLAEAYDLVQIPISGVNSGEPSAAQVATVIKTLKKNAVQAVFLENTKNNRLLEQLAHDAGIKVGGRLVADALEKEGDGATYLGMMQKNTTTLLEALE